MNYELNLTNNGRKKQHEWEAYRPLASTIVSWLYPFYDESIAEFATTSKRNISYKSKTIAEGQ